MKKKYVTKERVRNQSKSFLSTMGKMILLLVILLFFCSPTANAVTKINSFFLEDDILLENESTTMTLIFEEPVIGLEANDFSLQGATINNFQMVDSNKKFTATITAIADYEGKGVILLRAGSYYNLNDFSQGAGANLRFLVGVKEPSVQLSIDDVTNDNILNQNEVLADIDITGQAQGDFNEGDIVTLIINEMEYTGAVNKDGIYSITVPGSQLEIDSDFTIQASITTTNKYGLSASALASKEYEVDTEIEVAISIDSIAEDNIINQEESNTEVEIIGKVTGDFKEGDIVTLTIGEDTYTGKVDVMGKYVIMVPGSILEANSDKMVRASISVVDIAGNTAHAMQSAFYKIEKKEEPPAEQKDEGEDVVVESDDIQQKVKEDSQVVDVIKKETTSIRKLPNTGGESHSRLMQCIGGVLIVLASVLYKKKERFNL